MEQESKAENVPVITARDLLHGGSDKRPLKLDSYQRGFSWDERRMRQLVDDLARHGKSHGTSPVPYYLGTVLIHAKADGTDDDESHYVIDGQQRIAALTLLWKWLGGAQPERVQFEYTHTDSQQRLKAAYQGLSRVKERLGDRNDLFDKICVTQFVTSSEDEAFSFFDSQNSRGVPLEDADLLKAFHLDAIGPMGADGNRDDLQKEGAQRWEKIFRGKDQDVTAGKLFKDILTPARRAANGRLPLPASRPELLAEFRDMTYWPRELGAQRRSKIPGGEQTVPCFPSPFRTLEANLEWSSGSAGRGWTPTIGAQAFGTEPRNYPFSLRQPLSSGMGFFLYAERYAALTRELCKRPEKVSIHDLSDERDGWTLFRRLHWILYSSQNNDYLARAFLMAGLLYVDRFEDHRLAEFALWLEHLLGSVRLCGDHIHEQHPLEKLQQSADSEGDLFNLLSNSFLPDPVIGWAQEQARSWQRKLAQPDGSSAKISGGPKINYIQKSAEFFGLKDCIEMEKETKGDKTVQVLRLLIDWNTFQEKKAKKAGICVTTGGKRQ